MLKLKPTRPEHRRYGNTLCCDGHLADGTEVAIGAENDMNGGLVVWVGSKAYLLPYAAIVKAVEEERRG